MLKEEKNTKQQQQPNTNEKNLKYYVQKSFSLIFFLYAFIYIIVSTIVCVTTQTASIFHFGIEQNSPIHSKCHRIDFCFHMLDLFANWRDVDHFQQMDAAQFRMDL